MPDGKRWTLANLRADSPASYCYNDDSSNCGRYGRLYTWEAARKACGSLGSGWHLPTMEEWRNLAKVYGGLFGDGPDSGKAAFRALLVGGRSGLEMLLGGGGDDRRREYARLEADGFYWSVADVPRP